MATRQSRPPSRQPFSFTYLDQHSSSSPPDRGSALPFVFGDEQPLPFVQPASSLAKHLPLPLCPFAPLPRAGPQCAIEAGCGNGPLPIGPPRKVVDAPMVRSPMALPFTLLARKPAAL
jgi:hypothetical protein